MKIYYATIEKDELNLKTFFIFEEEGNVFNVRSFEGTLLKMDDDGYFLRGVMDYSMQTVCDRCLEQVNKDFELFVNVTIEPNMLESGFRHNLQEEYEILDDDGDVYFSNPDFLDLHDVLRQEIILNIPIKILCEPECSKAFIDDSNSGDKLSPFGDLKNKFKEK